MGHRLYFDDFEKSEENFILSYNNIKFLLFNDEVKKKGNDTFDWFFRKIIERFQMIIL